MKGIFSQLSNSSSLNYAIRWAVVCVLLFFSGVVVAGGGGGGLYGGGGGLADNADGGGGSGYIGNSLLTDKYMYCYNCTESSDTNTLTYSTLNVSSTAISS